MRSKLFYSVQEEIIELISSKSDSCTGKKKKYFQDFNRQIAHIDCSLKDRFKKILLDNEKCLSPFLIYDYDKEWKNQIDDIGERLNTIRNDIDHGHRDIDLNGSTIFDIETLEYLIYAVYLTKANVKPIIVANSINKLFGLYLDLKEADFVHTEDIEEEKDFNSPE